MGAETHNRTAVRFLAQLAHSTGHILARLRGAYDNWPARGRGGVPWRISWNHTDNRTGSQDGQLYGLSGILKA